MTQYTVQAPDGHTLTIEGPPGATQEQVMQQAQSLYKPGTAPGGTSAYPLKDIPMGGWGAAIGQAGHELFGVGDVLGSLSEMAASNAMGRHIGYKQAYDEYMGALHVGAQNHPIAATAGGVVGGADAAGLTMLGGEALGAGKVLSAAPRVVTAPSTAAGAVRAAAMNGAKLAAQGAAAGGTTGAIVGAGQGAATGDPNQILPQAVAGGVGGAVTGGVAAPASAAVGQGLKYVAPKVAAVVPGIVPSLNDRVANTLSKLFGESPKDISAVYDAHVAANGAPPTLAELANYKQLGQIAKAARDSGPISEALTASADSQGAARAANLQTQVETAPGQRGPTAPQSPTEAATVRDQVGDQDYEIVRQHSFPLEGTPDAPGYENTPHGIAMKAYQNAGLKTLPRQQAAQELSEGFLSGGSVDNIRKGLSRQGQTADGMDYQELRDEFLDQLSEGNSAGAKAMQLANANYAANAARANGVQLGTRVLGSDSGPEFAAQVAGRTAPLPGYTPPPNVAAAQANAAGGVDSGARAALSAAASSPKGAANVINTLANDPAAQAKVATAIGPEAAQGLTKLAQVEQSAQVNAGALRRTISPDADKDQVQAINQVAHGLATVAGHGTFYPILHGLRVVAGGGMPEAVQRKVAQYLADPTMTEQGLNILRRAGATNDELRRAMMQWAATVGSTAGAASTGTTNAP